MSEPADEPDGPSVDLPEPEEVFDLSGGLLDVPTDATQEVKLDWETDAPSVPGPGQFGVPLHEVQPVSPFGAPLPANAPLGAEDKASGRFADAVSPPPITAAAPTGPRAPAAGQHNWVPRGPRNLGGRVSALAISPADPRTMYAGAASGGVFKTIDGGESWFPLPFWHDAPSLAIGAIGICHDHPLTVYVATGEVKTGGN